MDSASTDDTAQIMRRFAERAPFEVKLLENPEALAGQRHQRRAARSDGRRRDPSGRARAHAEGFSAKESGRAGPRGGYRRRERHAARTPETAWEAVTRALDTVPILRRRSALSATAAKRATSIRWPTRSIAARSTTAWGYTTSACAEPRITTCITACARPAIASYFSPDIVSWHAARKTLRGQLSQKWGNGYWIGRTMRIQPRCFAPRHLVPALFVLALIVLALLCPLSPLPLPPCSCSTARWMSLYAAKAALEAPCGKLLTFICLPFLFPVVHIVYGDGHALRSADRKGSKAMLEWIDDITALHLSVVTTPQKADILFIPGNGHAEPSEYAAQLYHSGLRAADSPLRPLLRHDRRVSTGSRSGARTLRRAL